MGGLTVTTSWDDGHRLDPRVGERLRAHGLPGTFYVAPRNREFPAADRLSPAALVDLAADFEIGSHTLTHPVLTRTADGRAMLEIADSKKMLEDLLARRVDTFCYPRGAYQPKHVSMVVQAGYRYARTVSTLATGTLTNPLQAPTTLETGRFSLQRGLIDLARAARAVGSAAAVRSLRWDDIAIALFDRCLVTGGVFHLWGHSWVLESRAEWSRLDRVLAHIAGRPGVRYVENGALSLLAAATGRLP